MSWKAGYQTARQGGNVAGIYIYRLDSTAPEKEVLGIMHASLLTICDKGSVDR